MASPQFFQRSAVQTAIADLTASRGSFTIFCGAGTSIDTGLPAWETLISAVDDRFCDERAPSGQSGEGLEVSEPVHGRHLAGTPLDRAAVTRARLTAAYADRVEEDRLLRRLLEGAFVAPPKAGNSPQLLGGLGETVRAVATLYLAAVEAWRTGPASATPPLLITQNYDLLIEAGIAALGVTPVATTRPLQDRTLRAWYRRQDRRLPVVHLHGHVGYPVNAAKFVEDPDSPLVFDEHDYFDEVSQAAARLLQRRLSTAPVLFFGSSLADPHLVEALHRSSLPPDQGRHTALIYRPAVGGPGAWDDDEREHWARGRKLLRHRWESVGLNPLSVEFPVQLAQFAFEVGLGLRAIALSESSPDAYGMRLESWLDRVTSSTGLAHASGDEKDFGRSQQRISTLLQAIQGVMERHGRDAFGLTKAPLEELSLDLWIRSRGMILGPQGLPGTAVTDLVLAGSSKQVWLRSRTRPQLSVAIDGSSDVVAAFCEQQPRLEIIDDADAVSAAGWRGSRLVLPLYANDELGLTSSVVHGPGGELVGRMPIGVLVVASNLSKDSFLVRLLDPDHGVDRSGLISDMASVLARAVWDLKSFVTEAAGDRAHD